LKHDPKYNSQRSKNQASEQNEGEGVEDEQVKVLRHVDELPSSFVPHAREGVEGLKYVLIKG